MGKVPEDLRAPPLGTTLRRRYRLVRFLGAGGMGAVYEAVARDGSRVAVKVLLQAGTADDTDELERRFIREARVAAELDHPQLLDFVDAGFDHELRLPYFVTPLLVGMDVARLLEHNGPLHPAVAVRIVRHACDALQAAHDEAIVHRDIKPGNIFLEHLPEGTVQVKVLDFGMAKLLSDESTLTQTGRVMGTPYYMAPEQTRDAKNVDARTDVWSLAATLYEMLCGEAPFEPTQGFAQLRLRLSAEQVPSIQSRAPWIDPGLATVVHGALLREVEERCPSMRELAAALGPYAGGSEELTAAMLVHGVPEATRTTTADLAAAPTAWRRVDPMQPPPPIDEAPPDPLLGQTLAGAYRVLYRLGEGGMGVVYEAEHEDGTRYALKVIDPARAGKGASARRRFIREARAASSIDHDNVVRVIHADADLERELPLIVMELLQGKGLDLHIKQHGALDPAVAARIFIQACRGLHAAHERNFVHRDIKPGNLFLHTLPSGEVIVKVCDFGIAKEIDEDSTGDSATGLTRTGGVIGSPMYMSPEQAKDAKRVDRRTDVWSLGAALYETLSGAHPWRDATVGQLIVAICTAPLPNLQDDAPWMPAGLTEVVRKAMHRDLGKRYANAQELADALVPYTRTRATVMAEDIRPIAESVRRVTAVRAPPAESASEPALQDAAAAARSRSSPLRTGAIAALTALLAGGGVYYAVRSGSATEVGGVPPAGATSSLAASAPAATDADASPSRTVAVRVTIEPATAKVTVDGERRQVVDGALELEGTPGTQFAVVLRAGPHRVDAQVRIQDDGTVEPRRLELPDAARRPPTKAPSTAAPPPARTNTWKEHW